MNEIYTFNGYILNMKTSFVFIQISSK